MNAAYLLFLLCLAIAFIVWGTARKNFNAFFVLLLAALSTGILAGLPLNQIVEAVKTGFGETMTKIGIVILLGTALGVVLEKTGATLSLAHFLLDKIGRNRAPAAIAATGFVVGLPIFCDSGFIILSGLNKSLVRASRFAMPVMATALATALYSVHCLVPPHPGISAACGTMGADIGQVMLWGILLAVPGALAGYAWALRSGKRVAGAASTIPEAEVTPATTMPNPAVWRAVVPILLPVLLIGLKSVAPLAFAQTLPKESWIYSAIGFIGDPVIALLLALFTATALLLRTDQTLNTWLNEGVVHSGLVLAIIGAGGAFGNILKVAKIGEVLGQQLAVLHLGIWLPFVLAAALKTAQGSSTVAVITTASLLSPMLPHLGLDSDWHRVLATLAMGAGSMAVSHGSDAYFWVVSRFSELPPKVVYGTYTVATGIMAVVVQGCVWALFQLT